MPNDDDLTTEERAYQPLIQQLQKIYDTRIQDEQDLGAIRQQLSQTNLLPAASASQGETFDQDLDEENLDVVARLPDFPSSRKTSWLSPLSVLAATLIVVLLTGSLVTFLHLTRSNQSAATRLFGATSTSTTGTNSSHVATPCSQSYPITGMIIRVISNTVNPQDGSIMVQGPKEQFRGLLGETFAIKTGPNTRLFEQQGNGCHAVSLDSIRVGQRVQASSPQEILQSYPPQLAGVDTLVLLPAGS